MKTRTKLHTCLLIFPFLFLCTKENKAQCIAISESDSLELVAFYNVFDGPNWSCNNGWLNDPVKNWEGITLTDDNCHVSAIDLQYCGISSELNYLADLNLAYLDSLNLSDNALSGEIPNFTNLTNLLSLQLSDNELIGEIPNFNNLTLLSSLWLNGNNLSGEIPNFNNLTLLSSLWLNDNNLTAEIPNFNNLTILSSLHLGGNELTGTIPNFNNLPNLSWLWLNDNNLTTEIPNFNNLPNLLSLHLGGNELTGTIPNFNNLPNLSTLDLGGNELTGEIPNFNNLTNLSTLHLGGNELTGTIPNFNNLSNLSWLGLGGNELTGFVPNFNNLPNLMYLSICPNNFIGESPYFENPPFLDPTQEEGNCITPYYISGYAYYDQNNNNIKDSTELGLPNAKIYMDDSLKIALTDQNGFYTLGMNTESHTISYTPPFSYWEQSYPTSPDTYTITANQNGNIEDVNFANTTEIECPELSVSVGTPFLRKCFQNTYYFEYCNWGTFPADDAYIEVVLDETIIPLSASIPYIQEDNMLTFELGSIEIGECNTFTFIDSISCDAILGSAACLDATIFPNDVCETNGEAEWDGADLIVTGYCDEDSVRFEIENIGSVKSRPSIFRVYEDHLISAIEMNVLSSGESTYFTFPKGGVYHGIIEQSPNHPYSQYSSDFVELCGDESLVGLATDIPEWDSSLAFESDCQEIIGSYDPNDKLASPAGIGDNHYIRSTDELTYKIRFQNTGNDTAFTVIVVDTINTNYLDINTFSMDNSSHNYEFDIIDNNILQWTFNNILLVDSNTNEESSHGFLQFKIQQQANNQVGSIITNKAGIYFDYNDPILTPLTYHEIWFPDQDEDGVEDLLDICFGNDNIDDDLDGIPDACDNCPNISNPNQEDSNGNGIGNECESPVFQLND